MTNNLEVELRARQSLGISDRAIYDMVLDAIRSRYAGGGTLLDVGCGAGLLQPFVKPHFERYVGVDVVRYDEFPADAEFHYVNLDTGGIPLNDGFADVAVAVETIEHLENPRAFMRELVRLTRPGGWTIVTTPNQLSLLSRATLVVKGQFSAFQDNSYPAHLSALLESDLKRIAAECGLVEVVIGYSHYGRLPLTSAHYPSLLSKAFPRICSDNVLLIGKRRV